MVEHEDEAARWFAASRRGLMTQDERVAYESWRRNPANAAALAELQSIWLMLAPEADDPRAADDRVELEPVSRGAVISRTARVAAMLSAASIAIAVLTRLDSPWWTTLDWWSR